MTTSIKTCFKCGDEKPLLDFYRHPEMADGYLNKCKECTKSDVAANRNSNLDAVRAYDRRRGSRKTNADLRKYRFYNPEKNAAHAAVARAKKKGYLAAAPCMICGREDVHAHHDNYNRPLEISWLCPVHHFERHKSLGW